MKIKLCSPRTLVALGLTLVATLASAQQAIDINQSIDVTGFPKPIPVSISGFSGEVDAVLKQDLLFMGFETVAPDQAKYLIGGSNAGRVEARVIERVNKQERFAKAYTGGTPRSQTHALADDIAKTLTGKPGIAQTKIAFKAETGGNNSEIYIADYDGHNAQAVTQDHTIVAAPCWAGHGSLFYTSYKLGAPFIYSHDLSSGARRAVARFSGLNTSPAVSPDGRRVAMILSKSGSPDLWVSDITGGNLRQITATREEESSPCWSPDGQTICFASKSSGLNALYTISASGGAPRHISTAGVGNCTEPDWSPDGKWIIFTSQAADFRICLVPAAGGEARPLVSGEDPTWAPNSRAVIFVSRKNHIKTLSLLDVPTKHVKDVARILESNSQPSWAK